MRSHGMKALTGLLSIALVASLTTACEQTDDQPKIAAEECEKLAKRMLTYTVMESAKNAAQQEEMKKELFPGYLEACKGDLPTRSAYECAMAAPNTSAMTQCK